MAETTWKGDCQWRYWLWMLKPVLAYETKQTKKNEVVLAPFPNNGIFLLKDSL